MLPYKFITSILNKNMSQYLSPNFEENKILILSNILYPESGYLFLNISIIILNSLTCYIMK